MLVIGEQEVANKELSVRKQGEGDQGRFNLKDFITYFNQILATEE
jgi:threonyl-tRNA synthetase